jgi:catechol 2,3-dioxygenase-like lactoylglutathione lyase family enzyme
MDVTANGPDHGGQHHGGKHDGGQHHVRWCFHTTAMVADYERTRDALIRLVGMRVLEDSSIEDPGIARRGGMTWVGDNIIEIGEPLGDGAAQRFVQRFGSHMSSIAVQVADIDATVAFLEAAGVRIAARIDDHIVFTHPADTAGIVIEWFDIAEPRDPRFGGTVPAFVSTPLLDVRAMAFGGAVVDDPPSAAERLATLFAREVTFIDSTAPAGSPMAGVSLGDLSLALYPIPSASDSEQLWGWTYARAQTSNLGVLVPDLGVARRALDTAGIVVQRADDRSIVIPPSATGGVTLVVVEQLLHGDPRLAE